MVFEVNLGEAPACAPCLGPDAETSGALIMGGFMV